MLLLKQNITILLVVMASCLVFAKPTVNYCQTCLDVSEFIQEMEYNQTQSIVKQNLFKICLKENDGSNSKVCEFLSATMQNTLKRIGDKNFCSKVNACTSGKSIVKPPAHNSEKCRFCTNLLESFKSLIAESNINLVKESLNYYCELTNDFKDECQKNVNNHLMNFIDLLQNKVDSQTFCHAIDSCESEISYEKKLPSIGDLVSLRDPIQIADHLDFIEQQKKLESVNLTGYKNPITCLVCDQVVSIIYSQLHKNATREHVEKILAKSCKTIYLKDKVKEGECEAKVEKNIEIIIKGFMDKIKPRVVCILMGMCFPGQKLPGDEQFTNNAQEISTSSSSRPIQLTQSFKCYFCDKVVEFLFKELDQNKTREYVRKLLDKSCSILFKKGDRESKCEEYVNAYSDKLINLIEKIENPGLICNVLHMCPVNNTLVDAWDEKRLNNFIENEFNKSSSIINDLDFEFDWCQICTISYPILNELVQIDEVRDEIKVLTNEFCELLPIKDCRAKVNKYMDVITNIENSDAGCKQLNLCPVNKLSIDSNLQIIDLELIDYVDQHNLEKFEWKKLGTIECNTCKMLVKDLYKNLNHIIHSDITKHYINSTCELIPQDEYKKECEENAFKALEEIVNVLTKSLPPQQVCELLEYCKPKSTNNSLPLLKQKDDLACDICQNNYPTLHQLFKEKFFSDYVRNSLVNACNAANKPNECKAKVNQIVDNLSNEKTADKGCFTFCQQSFFTSSIQNLPECVVCQTSMVIIDTTLNNPDSHETIKNFLENFCNSRKGEFKSTCNNMLKDNLPKFYNIIKNLTDHDNGFCVKMGICNSSKIFDTHDLDIFMEEDLLKGVKELIPSVDELVGNQFSVSCPKCVCDGCKKLMGLVHEEVLSQKFLKDQILESLLKTCPKDDDACRKFYRKYVNGLYDTIERNTRPDKACKALKLCPRGLEFLKPPVKKGFAQTINLTESEFCQECKKVMGIVHDEVVSEKGLKDKILESLLKTCPKDDDACRKFYRKYVNGLYDMIEKNTRPAKACETLQLCSRGLELLKPVKKEFAQTINLTESEVCQECKKVMGIVHDEVVSEKGLKDQILESLLKTCPKDDDACRKFFRNNVNYLYDMIEKNTNPEKACAALKFCPNDFELFEPEFFLSINSNDDKLCKGCRSAINYLLKKLNDKAVVDKILQEIETNFCDPLIYLERKACTKFVKEFGPKIIKHFVSKIDEHTICNKDLKLCPNFSIGNTSEEMNFDLTNFFEDSNCLKCTRSVEKLNNLRGDTDKQFTVEEICKDDTECSEFMFNFGDFFLNNQHNRDPIILCTELDVCLIPGKVQLLGGDKCKYGPVYSCASVAHADACKATKFCQQNYWKTVEN